MCIEFVQITTLDCWEGLTVDEAYALLNDAYRMRMEDEYTFTGEVEGLYAGEGVDEALRLFRHFLNTAVQKDKVPAWWD